MLPRGLYIVTRPKAGGLVTHVGLLDIGNVLCLNTIGVAEQPLVLHHPPGGLVAVPAAASGRWETAVAVANSPSIRQRIIRAFQDPSYHLFENNCEHFLTFALSGEKKSPQLQGFLAIASLLVGAGLLLRWDT